MTKSKISKNSCEKKKGKGAKTHARKKKQGGKTLMPEISVISGFGGPGTPPQSPSKKMTKNKKFRKKFMREKKGKGASYF